MKRPKTEAEKAAFKAAMDKFVAAQRPQAEALFGPSARRASADELIEMVNRAGRIEQEHGVDNAMWVKTHSNGAFEITFSPVCPPGFTTLDEAIRARVAASPADAAYLKKTEDTIRAMGLPLGPDGILARRHQNKGRTND
jgi:hypothetical protein